MDAKGLIVTVATILLALAPLMNASAEVEGQIVVIEYDVRDQKILSVTDKVSGKVGVEYAVVNGIPTPLIGRTIRVGVVTILSDFSSPACTCAGNRCVTTCSGQ